MVVVVANVFNIVLSTVKHSIVAPFTDIHSTADCCNGIHLIIFDSCCCNCIDIVLVTVNHLIVVRSTENYLIVDCCSFDKCSWCRLDVFADGRAVAAS